MASYSERSMETNNGSSRTDFTLLGFSDRPQLERIISAIVFIFYIVTLLPRCGHRAVDNFFCEMPALIKMACVYSKVIEIVVFALGVVFLLAPLLLILISYGVITQAVMKIKSASRWRKILNTCGSHLTVVTLFYGTLIYMYMKPQNKTSQDEGKFFTLFYTIVTPSLNPLIYTLRNKDVKNAVKRLLLIKVCSSKSC
ncbi:olfactory receptor 2G6-like isoform X2 [Ochotona princeps]|uniref:olfactory receptor 2G6-like isoform X2 n=1 Tax=Ochotona princeps TaxID=9978 RepID=UPI002714C629|nr:olfactory receptor 2G6-like isoform X2 [Ochotona princeps]